MPSGTFGVLARGPRGRLRPRHILLRRAAERVAAANCLLIPAHAPAHATENGQTDSIVMGANASTPTDTSRRPGETPRPQGVRNGEKAPLGRPVHKIGVLLPGPRA
jgi:hypothetical protein